MAEKHASMSEVTAYLFMCLFLLQRNILIDQRHILHGIKKMKEIFILFLYFFLIAVM